MLRRTRNIDPPHAQSTGTNYRTWPPQKDAKLRTNNSNDELISALSQWLAKKMPFREPGLPDRTDEVFSSAS
jgi:hypothetical protein